MAAEPITHDTTQEGFVFFQGPRKLAVVYTKQEGPDVWVDADADGKNGKVQEVDIGGGKKEFQKVMRKTWNTMPRSSWTVHFTSPNMPVDLIEAIAEAIPLDEHSHSTVRLGA